MEKSKVSGSLVVCELFGGKKIWEYNIAKDEVVCTLCPHRISVTGRNSFFGEKSRRNSKAQESSLQQCEKTIFYRQSEKRRYIC